MVVNDVKQRKTATSTFYVIILFFIRYLPNYCNFVAYVSLCRPNATLKLFYLYSCSLLCLTSSLNPVIYCWKMIQVRCGTVRTLQNIFLRRNWTDFHMELRSCLVWIRLSCLGIIVMMKNKNKFNIPMKRNVQKKFNV